MAARDGRWQRSVVPCAISVVQIFCFIKLQKNFKFCFSWNYYFYSKFANLLFVRLRKDCGAHWWDDGVFGQFRCPEIWPSPSNPSDGWRDALKKERVGSYEQRVEWKNHFSKEGKKGSQSAPQKKRRNRIKKSINATAFVLAFLFFWYFWKNAKNLLSTTNKICYSNFE